MMRRVKQRIDQKQDNNEDITTNDVDHVFDIISETLQCTCKCKPLTASLCKTLTAVAMSNWTEGVFQNHHDSYQAKQSIEAIIESYKNEFWNMFRNISKAVGEEKVAADLLCDKLSVAVENAVEEKVVEQTRENINEINDKFYFLRKMFEEQLKDFNKLDKSTMFDKLMGYFKDPFESSKQWFKDKYIPEKTREYKEEARRSITSLLNAAIATALVLYEAKRQRRIL